MDITLIYIIKLLLLPPSGLLLVAIVGVFWYQRQVGRFLTGASLMLLWGLSLPITAECIAKYWENFPVLDVASFTAFKPEAIVILGGGLVTNAAEYQQAFTLSDRTLLRVRYAAKLAKLTSLPLLVSGGNLSDLKVSEAQIMAEVLQQEFNVPVAWQEHNSRNTAENAKFSAAILAMQNIHKIILVTQAYHIPRAVIEFRKAGLSVLAAPIDFIDQNAHVSIFHWIPSVKALQHNFQLVHEVVGMLWYRLRY